MTTPGRSASRLWKRKLWTGQLISFGAVALPADGAETAARTAHADALLYSNVQQQARLLAVTPTFVSSTQLSNQFNDADTWTVFIINPGG